MKATVKIVYRNTRRTCAFMTLENGFEAFVPQGFVDSEMTRGDIYDVEASPSNQGKAPYVVVKILRFVRHKTLPQIVQYNRDNIVPHTNGVTRCQT